MHKGTDTEYSNGGAQCSFVLISWGHDDCHLSSMLGSYHFFTGRGAVCFLGWSNGGGGSKFFIGSKRGAEFCLGSKREGGQNFFSHLRHNFL